MGAELLFLPFTHNFHLFKITVLTLVNTYSDPLVGGNPNFPRICVGGNGKFHMILILGN